MPMYDKGKIIPGLIVFLGLVTFPIWYGFGKPGKLPNPEKPTIAKQCVLPTAEMRTSHMQLLIDWRYNIVREDGSRIGYTADGTKYIRSLQRGCLKCHPNRKKFCEECHNYASVKPYCWDCHFQPGEAN